MSAATGGDGVHAANYCVNCTPPTLVCVFLPKFHVNQVDIMTLLREGEYWLTQKHIIRFYSLIFDVHTWKFEKSIKSLEFHIKHVHLVACCWCCCCWFLCFYLWCATLQYKCYSLFRIYKNDVNAWTLIVVIAVAFNHIE